MGEGDIMYNLRFVFLSLIIVAFGSAGCDSSLESPGGTPHSFDADSVASKWMTTLKEKYGEKFTSLKLKQLILPGTHDSASGGLEQGDSIVEDSVIKAVMGTAGPPENTCESVADACGDVCSCTNCADDCTDCSSDCSDCSDSCECSCDYCSECAWDDLVCDAECAGKSTKCGLACKSCQAGCFTKVKSCKAGCLLDFTACHTKCATVYSGCQTACTAKIEACNLKAKASLAACMTKFSAKYAFWATLKGAWASQIGPYIVTRFAKTQGYTLVGQFQAGARYFDLRVYVDDEGVLKFRHGPVEFHRPAKDALAKLANALSGTEEIIILQVSHFESESVKHSEAALEALTAAFGDTLIKVSDPYDMSIADLLKKGQVLVFLDDPPKDVAAIKNETSALWSPYHCSEDGDACLECPAKENIAQSWNQIENFYLACYSQKTSKGFKVLQAHLQYDASYYEVVVLAHMQNMLLTFSGSQAPNILDHTRLLQINKNVADWLERQNSAWLAGQGGDTGSKPVLNIIEVDDYGHDSTLFDQIYSMNEQLIEQQP